MGEKYVVISTTNKKEADGKKLKYKILNRWVRNKGVSIIEMCLPVRVCSQRDEPERSSHLGSGRPQHPAHWSAGSVPARSAKETPADDQVQNSAITSIYLSLNH